MKTTVNEIKRSFVFLVCALVAAAFSGCTNDDAVQTPQPTDGDIVQVTAQVASSELAFTRGADGLNDATSKFSLTSTTDDTKIRMWIDDGSNTENYTSYLYGVTAGATTLTPPTTPAYFPAGKNSVYVYGWYPSTDVDKLFTVKDDQSTDANYCLSDLMVAPNEPCTRALDGENNWSVTAASLTFAHVMSKVKITVTPSDGVTIKSVKLLGMKKQTTIGTSGSGADVTLTATTKADGTSGDIVLFSGTSTAAGTYCGVFPNQSKSGDFIAITAACRGFESTITYSLSAEKNFAQNQQYNISISVPATTTNQTVNITGWNGDDTNPLIIDTDLTDPAAMRTGDCMALNPLYWVAQYNIMTIKNVLGASVTAFYGYHAIPGNVFKFVDAGKLAASSSENSNYDSDAKIADYHLPNRNEQVSVIPSNVTTGSGANIFAQNNTSATSPYIMDQIACTVHKAEVPACKSYFLKVADLDYYAVRFVTIGEENNYASAWHYKMIPGSGLTIESYMLATKPTTEAEAKRVLAALPYSSAWEGAANEAPTTSSPTGTGVVRRFMPASGWKNGSSGVADQEVGVLANCVSATADGSNCFLWGIDSSGGLYEYSNLQTDGRCVRLFRD